MTAAGHASSYCSRSITRDRNRGEAGTELPSPPTLQHPVGQACDVLERCWLLLYRIWVAGDDPLAVTHALREAQRGAPLHLTAPPLPPGAAEPRSFPITIADLGDFEARDYPRLLEAWCRATLRALGIP